MILIINHQQQQHKCCQDEATRSSSSSSSRRPLGGLIPLISLVLALASLCALSATSRVGSTSSITSSFLTRARTTAPSSVTEDNDQTLAAGGYFDTSWVDNFAVGREPILAPLIVEATDVNDDDNDDNTTAAAAAAAAAKTPTTSDTVDIWYQCAGDDYRQFSEALGRLVHDKHVTGQRPLTWGRRPSALPPNRTLLVVGNSHSRQVAQALAGQHGRHQILEVHMIPDPILLPPYTNKRKPTIVPPPTMVVHVRFTNHAQLWMVMNSYVVYSHEWVDLLQTQIGGHLLDDMDYIAWGMFNDCATNNTQFDQDMQRISTALSTASREEGGGVAVNCTHIAPPTLEDLNRVYPKPVAQLTLFNGKPVQDAVRAAERVAEQRASRVQKSMSHNGTENLMLVDDVKLIHMRAYVDELGMEATAPSRLEVNYQMDRGPKAVHGHRCVGPLGGYPDLAAWDLSEWVWNLHEQ